MKKNCRQQSASVQKIAKDKFRKAHNLLFNQQYIIRNEFIDKFVLCEITCKSVLEYYYKYQGSEKKTTDIKLDMRAIPSALKAFEINVDKSILNTIFSSYNKKGKKSAKVLRNGIIHALSEDDILEVISRKDEIYDAMNIFLSFFKEESFEMESANHEKELMPVL